MLFESQVPPGSTVPTPTRSRVLRQRRGARACLVDPPACIGRHLEEFSEIYDSIKGFIQVQDIDK
eukprot:7711408-Pyramimonas_sp.AAC.1